MGGFQFCGGGFLHFLGGGCLPDSGGFEPPNPPENPSMVYQYIVPNEIGQTMRVRDPNCMKFYCSSIYDILLYKAVKISNKFNERFFSYG